MPRTNPIPAWSANLSVNVPQDERVLLQRLSANLGARSLAQMLKVFIAEGVAKRCETSAAELREIRKRYYGASLALIFLAALITSWLNHDELQRQCRRCTRRGVLHFEECIDLEAEEA